jgi:signal peptidase II
LRKGGFVKKLLLLILPFYLLDQITKWLVVRSMDVGDERTVIPGFFTLLHATNRGSAFGMFQDRNAYFIALSVVVLIGLGYFYRKGAFPGVWPKVGVSLFVAGILGNLTDRLVRGHVVDFLSFDLHVRFANPWATFNIADSCICVAAGIFMIQSLFEKKESGGAA